jgi:uncharacterized protein (DUF2235 family)
MLPFTRRNPSVAIFRHAIAIDERRRMFRLNRWTEPQPYAPNPFNVPDPPPQQDIKQVWFAGVHADVGGGYAEEESALSKYPLDWMIQEAIAAGVRTNTAMRNHLVRGHERKGSRHKYVAPDPRGTLHDSLTAGWKPLEYIAKNVKWREWPKRPSFGGWYLPLAEPRPIPEGARIHFSVIERQKLHASYRPVNMPASFSVEPDPELAP